MLILLSCLAFVGDRDLPYRQRRGSLVYGERSFKNLVILFCVFVNLSISKFYSGGKSVCALTLSSDVKKIVTMPCKRIQTGVREK